MRRIVLVLLAVIVALLLGRALFTPRAARLDTASGPAVTAADGALAAGEYYVLALDLDGRVFGWGGFETSGGAQLLSAGRRPRLLLEGSGYRRIAAGHRAIYALDSESRLHRASLAAATAAPPAPVVAFRDRAWRLAIETWGVGVGIDRDGGLWHWSDEDLERALRGEASADSADQARPRPLMKGFRFVDACVQNVRVHAVSDDGRLWRSDDLARRGFNEGPLQGERWELQELSAGAPLRRVYCRENAYHVLALDDRGRIWGYGVNSFGELGIGKPDSHSGRAPLAATRLELLSEQRFIALAVGPQVSLGIARDGSLWGWGKNNEHELGLGDGHSRDTPTLIDRSRTWVAVAATYGSGVALSASGEAYAWGANSLGALGDGGVAAARDTPTPVLTDHRFGGTHLAP